MRKPASGITIVELLVVMAIAATISTVLLFTFSSYSNTYLRMDDRMENASRAWHIVQMIQEDILALDLPDNDIKCWKDAVQQSADRYILTRREGNEISTVTYEFDQSERSLKRCSGDTSKTLIKNRCSQFSLQIDADSDASGKLTGAVRIHFTIRLEEQQSAQKRGFEPLTIETTLVPEFLNRKLHQHYFHEGIPE